jgi:Cell wall-active antibiotics response 4TMS YvqF/Domain of unknown function (DUF1707)
LSLELEREQAVQELCAHYAQDHLSTGELETRFEHLYRSRSREDLRTALGGLPALRGTSLGPSAIPLYQLAPVPSRAGILPPGEKRYLSIFAEVKKEGAWTPPPVIVARILFGSMVLDLREAELPLGGITIDADVMFGECKVLLPPGVGADVDATAILGTVTDKAQRALPGAPIIRVRGSAMFGEIVVKTMLPKPARMESWRKQLKAFFGTDAGGDGSAGGSGSAGS